MAKIVFNYALFDIVTDREKVREVSIELTPDLTLEQAVGLADLSSYYPLSGVFSFNNQYIPYIISNGEVKWNVLYREAKVVDFIDTHRISDNTIVSSEGYPLAGGPGFIDILEIWNRVFPIIDQFVTTAGAITIATGTGKWIASKFNNKEVPPHSYFDLIFSRQSWNHFELSNLLGIDAEDAQRILISFAYKYDEITVMYVQQEESLDLKEKLSKVKVHQM